MDRNSTNDSFQNAITNLRQIETNATEKAGDLETFIEEVNEVKEVIEEQGNNITELISPLEEVSSIIGDLEDAMSTADTYIN